jgi:hypothetical protein
MHPWSLHACSAPSTVPSPDATVTTLAWSLLSVALAFQQVSRRGQNGLGYLARSSARIVSDALEKAAPGAFCQARQSIIAALSRDGLVRRKTLSSADAFQAYLGT